MEKAGGQKPCLPPARRSGFPHQSTAFPAMSLPGSSLGAADRMRHQPGSGVVEGMLPCTVGFGQVLDEFGLPVVAKEVHLAPPVQAAVPAMGGEGADQELRVHGMSPSFSCHSPCVGLSKSIRWYSLMWP